MKRLRMLEVAGATVYRGIHGYGAKGHERRRDLPIMLSVVDAPEKIAAAASAIEDMLEDGLILIADVEIVRLVRSSNITEGPDASSSTR